MPTKSALHQKHPRRPSKPRTKKIAAASHANLSMKAIKQIPQKVLLYAAKTIDPPAISDEVPEEMPFIPEGD